MSKKLVRSTNKKILGVAGGLAQYFDLDPTFVRLALLVMIIFDGSGTILITYLAAGLLMPKPSEASAHDSHDSAEKFNSEDIRVEDAHDWSNAAAAQ